MVSGGVDCPAGNRLLLMACVRTESHSPSSPAFQNDAINCTLVSGCAETFLSLNVIDRLQDVGRTGRGAILQILRMHAVVGVAGEDVGDFERLGEIDGRPARGRREHDEREAEDVKAPAGA